MTAAQLIEEINSLTPNREQALNFIAFSKPKAQKQSPLQKRPFGAGNGFFTMREDFDKPLEGSKE